MDMSTIETSASPEPELHDHFQIVTLSRHENISRQIESHAPDVICFNFDYPDRAGSRLVEEIKRVYPSIPAFIVTTQHSEELAVWAFRAKMTDFLVKPLEQADLLRCIGVLDEICRAKRQQSGRSITNPNQLIPASITSRQSDANMILAPALYYVESHYADKIRSEDIARLCGLSSFRFSRLFKETHAITFRDYVVRYRLRLAYKLLSEQRASVTDAAFAVGFSDISYFSRMFKRHFDCPPSELVENVESGKLDSSPTAILHLPAH